MIVYAIAAVVFVVLTLAIPFPKPAASWMMFAFTLVSFAGGCGITLFAFSKSNELKSKFYGYPVFRIGFLYTAIQLALTALVYIIGGFVNVPYWVGLTLAVLLMGLAAIGVITTDTARDFVEETEEKTVVATKTIRKFQVDNGGVLYGLVAYLMGGVDAGAVEVDLGLVDIEADDLDRRDVQRTVSLIEQSSFLPSERRTDSRYAYRRYLL